MGLKTHRLNEGFYMDSTLSKKDRKPVFNQEWKNEEFFSKEIK